MKRCLLLLVVCYLLPLMLVSCDMVSFSERNSSNVIGNDDDVIKVITEVPNYSVHQAQLDETVQFWESQGIVNYTYGFGLYEYYPRPNYYHGFAVKVRNGAVCEVYDWTTETYLDPATFPQFKTIPDLYSDIQMAIDENYSQIDVDYNFSRFNKNQPSSIHLKKSNLWLRHDTTMQIIYLSEDFYPN